MRLAAGVFVSLFCTAALASASPHRSLSFAERVKAQAAIERVYYAHQLGTKTSFDKAMPKTLLESKVRKYLDQTAALSARWKTAVTDEMLERELERMEKATRMPERLSELFSALGNDPFIIKECLARATLVDRLSRSFYAFDSTVHAKTTWDAWWAASRGAFSRMPVATVAAERGSLSKLATNDSSCANDDDSWDNGSLYGGPDSRSGHTAVWTGSLMIVWGGRGATGSLDTGGRYDPATDRWTEMSTKGAPSARAHHTAVWTGSLMIVRGGTDDASALDTGGRYDPASDTWTPTAVTGAPSGDTAVWTGRAMLVWGSGTGAQYDPAADVWTPIAKRDAPSGGTAVWTGNSMIVWDGAENSGGRYDPESDSWKPMAKDDAPAECTYQTAVWTGNLMVVWCTHMRSGESTNSGARYDPVVDAWTPMSTVDGHVSGGGYSAVWTGGSIIVWGGTNRRHFLDDEPRGINRGDLYDPDADSWKEMSTDGAPQGSFGHTAVWAGTRLVVWGGDGGRHFGGSLNTGGRYEPETNRWMPTATDAPDAPGARGYHSAVWTGSLMIVWGGADYFDNAYQDLSTGGRYDPTTDSWTPMSTIDAPYGRNGHTAVWTGNVMVVWGGGALDTGGRYDPAADRWTPTATTGAPSPRSNHTSVWTGSRMVVWGGDDAGGRHLDTGGRYDPATDRWDSVSQEGAPSAAASHTAVWTGDSMLVWGGSDPDDPATGGRYDPVRDTWTPMSTTGAPDAIRGHSAVWTGRQMLVWGGANFRGDGVNTGGSYDPASDSWTPMSITDAPTGRSLHTAVWAGGEMIVWGGYDGNALDSGGRYDPASDAWTPTSKAASPSRRYAHTAVWTGSSLVLWGGQAGDASFVNTGGQYVSGTSVDNDTDGFSECQGDCNDTDSALHPGAPDTCNGIDDDCDGVTDNDGDALCDDGNACTADACDSQARACVHPMMPNGTLCHDATLCTTGESCQSGACTPAFSGVGHPSPRNSGFYRQLCTTRVGRRLPYPSDPLTAADASCVSELTSTFSGISTVDDICAVIGGVRRPAPAGPNASDCVQGELELMATALNICRARVCEEQPLKSRCHGNAPATVSQLLWDADTILDATARGPLSCRSAVCELREINGGAPSK